MFGIDAGEIMMLVVLGVIMFGPEKIPEMSRKAARVVHYLRNVANQATDQIKGELGPEYADLTIDDLNPKKFIQKHLLDDVQGDINDIKGELMGVKTEVTGQVSSATKLVNSINADITSESRPSAVATVARPARRIVFDIEAT